MLLASVVISEISHARRPQTFGGEDSRERLASEFVLLAARCIRYAAATERVA